MLGPPPSGIQWLLLPLSSKITLCSAWGTCTVSGIEPVLTVCKHNISFHLQSFQPWAGFWGKTKSLWFKFWLPLEDKKLLGTFQKWGNDSSNCGVWGSPTSPHLNLACFLLAPGMFGMWSRYVIFLQIWYSVYLAKLEAILFGTSVELGPRYLPVSFSNPPWASPLDT